MFADHTASVAVHLGDREARTAQVGNLLREGIVATGGLRSALDDVTSDHCTGKGVEVGAIPAEVRSGWSDHEGGVGDAAGHNEVRACIEALDDSPSAEIGVCRQR